MSGGSGARAFAPNVLIDHPCPGSYDIHAAGVNANARMINSAVASGQTIENADANEGSPPIVPAMPTKLLGPHFPRSPHSRYRTDETSGKESCFLSSQRTHRYVFLPIRSFLPFLFSRDFAFTFVRGDDCTKNGRIPSASQPHKRSEPASLCFNEGEGILSTPSRGFAISS